MCKWERLFEVMVSRARGVGITAVILALVLLSFSSAYAFNIPTGNDDIQLRWDNTVRYGIQYRLLDADEGLNSNINGDDGNRNFASGITSNRLDLLSELDLIYRPLQTGVRVSGAFWYDQAYHDSLGNDSPATSNYFRDGVQQVGLYKFYDRYYAGPYGELLDLFVFTKFNVGEDVPVYLKIGRHVYSWGESLLNPFHGINYGQMPLDLAKAQALPGIEVKELFRPLNSADVVIQFSQEFQLVAQYFFQWQRNLLPGAGTYFGTSDISMDGDGTLLAATGGAPGTYFQHGRDIEAARGRDFGVGFKYAPKWTTDTTIGFYYRRFSDKMPQVILNTGDMTYHAAYKSDIDLFGISASFVVAGTTVGTEVSVRNNMPLAGGVTYVSSAAELPDDGDVLGPRGRTLHAIFNQLGTLKKTPLWDAGSWMWEIDYSRKLKVQDDPQNAYGGNEGYGFGRVTDDAGNFAVTFSPQYLQVLPGLDVTVPLSLAYGLWGVSPVAAGNGEGDGNWSIGLNFDYLTKYKLNLVYSNFFGKLADNGYSTRGNYAAMKDRDFIAATLKYSF